FSRSFLFSPDNCDVGNLSRSSPRSNSLGPRGACRMRRRQSLPGHARKLLVVALVLWTGVAASILRAQEPPPAAPPPRPVRPDILNRPLEVLPPPAEEMAAPPPVVQLPFDAPLGFTGPSGILSRDTQETADFVPLEDRWRIGFPPWDRYGKGH